MSSAGSLLASAEGRPFLDMLKRVSYKRTTDMSVPEFLEILCGRCTPKVAS